MSRILFALFVVVPIIEIAIFVALGGLIGFWWTMGGIVFTAILGSILLRQQGMSVLFSIQNKLNAGGFPAQEIVDGVMLAIAGALLLTPGFFTDAVGFSLFVPLVRQNLFTELRKRVKVVSATSYQSYHQGPGPGGFHRQDDEDVIDLEDDHWRDDKR
ncbi:FxsA family protein [Maritalea mediterranea]|uniref:FxsA family protein n=1 Tax=Maritalea mediterranea TaxID=2909667 RepID=A0ABS9E238_9HYPH|nr:FxsA family protein [Maritalea mediterranea]MCF4096925.1 FxsA family protein [Maritalea mediterranea]